MKKHCLFILIGCFFFSTTLSAQTPKEDLLNFIKRSTDSLYEKEAVPGIFVAVLHNNERYFFNAGFADTDKKILFDSATLFEIGSITKTFTAYILTAVLHEKKIAETASIVKYLPDSVQQNADIKNVSFVSLLNHTAGFPRLPDNIKPANNRQPYEDYSSALLFNYLKSCELTPDGKSNYSNLGAGLAGVLAERISGKSYAALLDQYIFLPFKMVNAENSLAKSDNQSAGYYATGDKTPYWNMNVLAPAGGLKCNATEMLTYLQNMCIPQSVGSKLIVDTLTSQTVALNPKVGIGRGWHIFNDKDQPLFYWHNGGTYGFSTFCAFTKNKSKAVFVVINQFNKNAFSDGLGAKIIKKLISEE